MSEYLDGSLSNVSLATAHQTYSAPAHNFEENLTGGILKFVAIKATLRVVSFIAKEGQQYGHMHHSPTHMYIKGMHYM